jgi:hypothetical protein
VIFVWGKGSADTHGMRNEITASEQRSRDSFSMENSHLYHTERVDRP